MELIGFSKEVKYQLRNFMSPSVCPTTIGQVSFANIISCFPGRKPPGRKKMKRDARKI